MQGTKSKALGLPSPSIGKFAQDDAYSNCPSKAWHELAICHERYASRCSARPLPNGLYSGANFRLRTGMLADRLTHLTFTRAKDVPILAGALRVFLSLGVDTCGDPPTALD